MGTVNFDVVSLKNAVVVVSKRSPPGSVYRSPQGCFVSSTAAMAQAPTKTNITRQVSKFVEQNESQRKKHEKRKATSAPGSIVQEPLRRRKNHQVE
ncbi:hypothetical protein DVH24_016502 [Malus domestica]|uniref:Uncharacterized protein n=1 Tax=Malus domestica TaxID=3750 RepID=A0A498HSG1_MALDO|nr:hypothetical protein DVH24_016502 [Malus domestica]